MVSNPSGSVITPEALIPLGPVAFAIHDFYAAMLEFAVETDHRGTLIECVNNQVV